MTKNKDKSKNSKVKLIPKLCVKNMINHAGDSIYLSYLAKLMTWLVGNRNIPNFPVI